FVPSTPADNVHRLGDQVTPPEVRSNGFEVSWQAGEVDDAGHHMTGTEIIQIVAHKGKLYAGTSLWWDNTPIEDHEAGAQILRLDSSQGKWQVDHLFTGFLTYGKVRYLRIDAMESVTFTTDGQGQKLSEPVTILLAVPFDQTGPAVVFSRDDDTGQWTEMV